MRWYLDTEFNENGKTIELISLGLINEAGREFYACSAEINETRIAKANPWVGKNVLSKLPPRGTAPWMTRKQMAKRIEKLLLPDPSLEFWGYFCLVPETRVLSADLRWLPIGDMRVGDKLIGFDEYAIKGKGRSSRWRRWQSSDVAAVRRIKRPCYELSFADGTRIRCSEDHRWLAMSHEMAKWKTAAQLEVGRDIAKPLDTWKTLDSRAGGYLAAAFDGEGHLSQKDRQYLATPLPGKKFRAGFSQKDNVMLTEVRNLMPQHGFEIHEQRNKSSNVVTMSIDKRKEVLRLLGSVRPIRLLEGFRPDSIGAIPMRPTRLIRKRRIGTQQVVSLTTSTRTFVAEGFASHNCDYDWVVFAQLWGRMIDLPEGMPMFTHDIKQEMGRLSVDKRQLPEQDPLAEHDALDDARWNRAAHMALMKYEAKKR